MPIELLCGITLPSPFVQKYFKMFGHTISARNCIPHLKLHSWQGRLFSERSNIFRRNVGHELCENARITVVRDYNREFTGVADYLRGTLKPRKFAYARLRKFDRSPCPRFKLTIGAALCPQLPAGAPRHHPLLLPPTYLCY